MAAWHFKFSLVPSGGVRRYHRDVDSVLVEYCSSVSQGAMLNEAESEVGINYWDGFDIRSVGNELARSFPPRASWSADAVMLGYDDGDRIEVWVDDLVCQIDVRNFSLESVRSIVEVAEKFDCLLVLHGEGRVIEPRLDVLLSEIEISAAYEFCLDPKKFMMQRAGKSDLKAQG